MATEEGTVPQTGDREPPDKHVEEEDEVATQICCLKGCLSSSVIAFLFFVMLPAGILLILFADKNDNYRILPVGILLICLPFIVTPIVVYILLHRKQLKNCLICADKKTVTTLGS